MLLDSAHWAAPTADRKGMNLNATVLMQERRRLFQVRATRFSVRLRRGTTLSSTNIIKKLIAKAIGRSQGSVIATPFYWIENTNSCFRPFDTLRLLNLIRFGE